MGDWTQKTENVKHVLQVDSKTEEEDDEAHCKLESKDFTISGVRSLTSESLPVTEESFVGNGAFTCFGAADPDGAKGTGRSKPQQRGGGKRTSVSNEVRATLVNLVLDNGMSMREAGQRVQPNLSRYTVASIIRTFRQENRTDRRLAHGGRPRLLSEEQQSAIVKMAAANNFIRLREIQNRVIEDQGIFRGIDQISIATIDRIILSSRMEMKQIIRVPFDRNSEAVKDQRLEYVQRMLEFDAQDPPHEFIFIDEAGFKVGKRKKRANNIIGNRAIMEVPGQRGGNITLCAAISHHGILHRHATLGPYNTAQLVAFLSHLRDNVLDQVQVEPEQSRYVIIWNNVSFHNAAAVCDWFTDNPRFSSLFLPTCSPFLSPLEEFFSVWRWKVFGRNPYEQVSLLQAMEEACGDIALDSVQGWIAHTREYFSLCLDRTNIVCDVDEVMWPDPAQRQDSEEE